MPGAWAHRRRKGLPSLGCFLLMLWLIIHMRVPGTSPRQDTPSAAVHSDDREAHALSIFNVPGVPIRLQLIDEDI